MPTLNPRISVTLKPSTDAILRRLSAITGNSKSSLVSDILEQSENLFEKIVLTLEAAEKVKSSLASDALDGFEKGHARLQEQLGMAMDLFDTASKPILDHAESIDRRSARVSGAAGGAERSPRSRSPEPSLPPHVTRGSGTPNTVNKTISISSERGQHVTSKPIKTPSKAIKPKKKG